MSSNKLVELIKRLDYVQDFQEAEAALRANTAIWADYEQMKALQKDAILYRKLGKSQAYKETMQAAERLEKRLKMHPLVLSYLAKMEDVSDLLLYVTSEIERKVNEKLEKSA